MKFDEFKNNVECWAEARGIYKHSTAEAQLMKALSELGELSDAVIKSDEEEIRDAIGDIAVCLVNYSYIVGYKIIESDIDVDQENGEHVPEMGSIIGASALSIGSLLLRETHNQRNINEDQPNRMLISCLSGAAYKTGNDFMVCCEKAWDEIKHRGGKMSSGGAFVKDE